MSDITRLTTSDVAKTTKSDVSKTKSDATKTKSDFSKTSKSGSPKTKPVTSKATKSDVTKSDVAKRDIAKTKLKFSLPVLARRMLGPKLLQKGKLMASPGTGSFGNSGVIGQFGGGDRLVKTVNALRAAVRFKWPAELDMRLAEAHRLDPVPECCFKPDKVRKLMDMILENTFADYRYEGRTAAATVLSLSQQITDEVKIFEFPRYKLVTQVIMGQGQVQGQNLQISSRCLWNSYSDSYACATYETPNYFVVALVHATYFE